MAKIGTPMLWKIWPPTEESLARFDAAMERSKKRINHTWHPVEIVGEPLDPNRLTPWELTEKTYQKHLKALKQEEGERRKRTLKVDAYWEPLNPADYNALFWWTDWSMAQRIREIWDNTLGLKWRNKK